MSSFRRPSVSVKLMVRLMGEMDEADAKEGVVDAKEDDANEVEANEAEADEAEAAFVGIDSRGKVGLLCSC